jgi:uncharacterized DUF497 family protein
MLLFRWDETKAASNKRKHGITFDDATHVFEDPYAIFEMDRIVEGEARWQTLGSVDKATLLLVAYTIHEEGQDEIVRIISARRATRTERKRYGQNRYENLS